MTTARLQYVGGGNACGEVGAAGESVSARAVGEVVESTAANVGNVNAKAELVPAAGVGGEVCSVKVIFGAARIGLCAAGCEQSRHCELRIAADAAHGVGIVAEEKPQLVQPARRELVQMADIDFVLKKTRVGAGAGENGSTDGLIFYRAVFVGIADPELVSVREVVEDAS